MENKSCILELIHPSTEQQDLLISADKKYLNSDLLNQEDKSKALKEMPINKLLENSMHETNSNDSFTLQNLDWNFNTLKKKRRKKVVTDNQLVANCDDIELKTNFSKMGSVLPDNSKAEMLKDTDKVASEFLKPENQKLNLKETPIKIEAKVLDTFNIQDLDYSLLLKKKRRKKILIENLFVSHDDVQLKSDSNDLLSNTKEDYDYEYLLSRIYQAISEKDPKHKSDRQKSIVMRPPQVIRIGTRRTSFINFLDICKTLHRSPQHLYSYILAELATNASIDSNNQLIIKGRFEQKQIETVLRHYIKEYVTCHACHSSETMLQKESRLSFLHCESCGSKWTVANIKSGFQAVTSKRAAIRAKANE